MIAKLECFLGLVFCAAASPAQYEAPKVELLMPKQVAFGQKVKATVRITFAPGLHAYQNPPSKDFMIPVTVRSLIKGVAASPTYPKGEVKMLAGEPTAVYEGQVDIPVIVKVPKKPGSVLVKLDVGYQQCTDQACDRPTSVPVSGRVLIAKPAKK